MGAAMERARRGAGPEGCPRPRAGSVHPGWGTGARGGRAHPGAGDEARGAGVLGRLRADGGEGAAPEDAVQPAEFDEIGVDAAALGVAVGRRIRRARTRAGLSQAALAERLGCARPTVCRWERGRREPSLGVLVRIAAAVGVRPAALLPDAGEEG